MIRAVFAAETDMQGSEADEKKKAALSTAYLGEF